MKSTGIVRRVDELGRVVIPIELRNQFDISEKDPIEIYVDGSTIVLKKFVPNCIFCGSDKDLTQYRDKQICKKCINKICRKTRNTNLVYSTKYKKWTNKKSIT